VAFNLVCCISAKCCCVKWFAPFSAQFRLFHQSSVKTIQVLQRLDHFFNQQPALWQQEAAVVISSRIPTWLIDAMTRNCGPTFGAIKNWISSAKCRLFGADCGNGTVDLSRTVCAMIGWCVGHELRYFFCCCFGIFWAGLDRKREAILVAFILLSSLCFGCCYDGYTWCLLCVFMGQYSCEYKSIFLNC